MDDPVSNHEMKAAKAGPKVVQLEPRPMPEARFASERRVAPGLKSNYSRTEEQRVRQSIAASTRLTWKERGVLTVSVLVVLGLLGTAVWVLVP